MEMNWLTVVRVLELVAAVFLFRWALPALTSKYHFA